MVIVQQSSKHFNPKLRLPEASPSQSLSNCMEATLHDGRSSCRHRITPPTQPHKTIPYLLQLQLLAWRDGGQQEPRRGKSECQSKIDFYHTQQSEIYRWHWCHGSNSGLLGRFFTMVMQTWNLKQFQLSWVWVKKFLTSGIRQTSWDVAYRVTCWDIPDKALHGLLMSSSLPFHHFHHVLIGLCQSFLGFFVLKKRHDHLWAR